MNGLLILGFTAFILAHFVRAFRLHIAMGQYRTNFGEALQTHFLGVALSTLFLPVYEITVIGSYGLKSRQHVFSAIFSVIILRVFDLSIVLLLLLFVAEASMESRYILISIFALLLLFGWLVLVGFEPLCKRAERHLIMKNTIPYDQAILSMLFAARSLFIQLPWQRSGTFPLICVLSLVPWFLEWLAVACLSHNFVQSLPLLLGRIGRSLGIPAPDPFHFYNVLMPSVYALAAIFTLLTVFKVFCKKR